MARAADWYAVSAAEVALLEGALRCVWAAPALSGAVLRGGLWLCARYASCAWQPRDLDLVLPRGVSLEAGAEALRSALRGTFEVRRERPLFADTEDPGRRFVLASSRGGAEAQLDLAQGYETLEPVPLAWPSHGDGRALYGLGSAPEVVLAELAHSVVESRGARAERAFAAMGAVCARERLREPRLAAAWRAARRRWALPAELVREASALRWPEELDAARRCVLREG